MSLDTLVAQVSFRAHLLQRALHDPGQWTVRFETPTSLIEVPAHKVALADGIAFQAQFPGHFATVGVASLCLNGEAVSYRETTASEQPFTIEWAIRGWIGDREHRPS